MSRRAHPPGFRASVVGLVGATITVVTFAVNAQSFRIHYELFLLRRSPERFLEILDRPDGSPERQALLRFVGTDRGRQLALEEYLDAGLQATLEPLAEIHPFRRKPPDLEDVERGVYWVSAASRSAISRVALHGMWWTGRADDVSPPRSLFLMPRLVGHHVRLEKYPALEFVVVRKEEPSAAYVLEGFDRALGGVHVVCVICVRAAGEEEGPE